MRVEATEVVGEGAQTASSGRSSTRRTRVWGCGLRNPLLSVHAAEWLSGWEQGEIAVHGARKPKACSGAQGDVSRLVLCVLMLR